MIGRNNPLNIRTSSNYSWFGQVGSTRGFCNFDSVAACRRAGAYLLMRSYRRAGVCSIDGVIKRWAPSVENPTNAYIDFVCKKTEFSPATKMRFDTDYAAVLAAMELFEQGIPANARSAYYANAKAAYLFVINNFNIKIYESQG